MSRTSDLKALRALLEHWARAVRCGDIEGVMAAHSRDVVMFDAPGPLWSRGLKAYRQAWVGFFEVQPKGKFNLSQLQLFASGNVGFGHALLRIGGKKTFQVRLTVGFERRSGQWLIVHEHHSGVPEDGG